MSKKLLPLFTGLSILLACEQSNEQVNWISYNRGQLHQNHSVDLRRNGYEFLYGHTDSTGTFQIYINILFNWEKRTLKMWEVDCPLLDSMSIPHGNQVTVVYKFFCDDPELSDEEVWVYVSREHGLLGLVEFAWSGHQVFQSNNQELLNKLENDTTDFFNKSRKFGS